MVLFPSFWIMNIVCDVFLPMCYNIIACLSVNVNIWFQFSQWYRSLDWYVSLMLKISSCWKEIGEHLNISKLCREILMVSRCVRFNIFFLMIIGVSFDWGILSFLLLPVVQNIGRTQVIYISQMFLILSFLLLLNSEY